MMASPAVLFLALAAAAILLAFVIYAIAWRDAYSASITMRAADWYVHSAKLQSQGKEDAHIESAREDHGSAARSRHAEQG